MHSAHLSHVASISAASSSSRRSKYTKQFELERGIVFVIFLHLNEYVSLSVLNSQHALVLFPLFSFAFFVATGISPSSFLLFQLSLWLL